MNNLKRRFFNIKPDASRQVRDKAVIDTFSANPNAPFLVSFPRTGSHWLRMLIELYFQRPTLVRSFYYLDKNDYLLLHTHDLDLDLSRRNVLYLYRNPIPTIYSQLQYHQEDTNNLDRIRFWATQYGLHLKKWLLQESFTEKKTLLCYERLQTQLEAEFAKVCIHLGSEFDTQRFRKVSQQVTKEEVKRKTPHDEQVITLNKPYSQSRETFQEQFGDYVWSLILEQEPAVAPFFER